MPSLLLGNGAADEDKAPQQCNLFGQGDQICEEEEEEEGGGGGGGGGGYSLRSYCQVEWQPVA